jgi:isoquinoline 1-oxidoreductase subunit alpha
MLKSLHFQVKGDPMPEYSLKINGRTHKVSVDADKPLLWILRDDLDLTGTKFGCGVAECGSCTVLLDGQPVRSCSLTAADAENAELTTIEGLRDHPVQKAWLDVDVAQCGFCQPGQILTAAALLAAKPKPTDTDIDQAMSDNICRCGTYQRIRKAIHKAAGSKA